MVQSPTCSPASASPSSSCGDALLAGLSLPVQKNVSHRQFHFPCASGLACGSPLGPRATFMVSVRGTLWLRMSKTTRGFHGSVQQGFTGTPEVSCGPMRGPEASCIKKQLNPAVTGGLTTELIVQMISPFMDNGFLGSHAHTYGQLLLLTRFTNCHILTKSCTP